MHGTGEQVWLSPRGQARRAAIGEQVLAGLARRQRRRQQWGAARLLLAAGVAFALCLPRPPAGPGPASTPAPDRGAVVVVHDQPGIATRLQVHGAVAAATYVDDAGLRRLLQQAERDAAVVRSGRRVLVPGLVVDDWRAGASP